MVNFVLTIFLGWTGYARFRKGQIGLGILCLFTCGCFCVGWIVDIVSAYKEYKGNALPTESAQLSFDTVFVNPGSRVYHCDQMCAMSHSARAEEMKEKQAIKKGLKRCKKCFGNF